MIQARNTYTVDVDRSTNPDNYRIILFIWKGDKLTVPTTAEYSISKDNVEGLTTIDSIGVSDIIRDFIEPEEPAISAGMNTYNNVVWVRYEVYLNEDVVPNQSDTLLFVDGYNIEDKNILLDGYELTMYDSYIIPVLVGSTYSVISYPDNQINNSYELLSNDESDDQISIIKITRPTTDKYIHVTNGTESIYLYPEPQTRLGVSNLTYINSFGVYQLLPFFNERKNSISVDKENFKVSASSSGHNYITYNTNGRGSISIKSGYHTEGTNAAFESLMLSEYVWMGDIYSPVNIESKNLNYKTRINDKVVSYELKIKESFDKITT